MPVLDDDGAPLPELLEVLQVVARHGLVLATGHLSRDEIFAVVDAAVAAGVETIVVTNPEFPSHRLSPADQHGAGRAGRADAARAAPRPTRASAPGTRSSPPRARSAPRSTVWGSDLGQVFNPPVEDGLAIMADRFLEAGFSEEEIRIMAVENTRRLAGA